MHEMQTIVVDDPGHLSVCLSVTWLRCENMAEWVEMLGNARNTSPDFSHRFNATFTK